MENNMLYLTILYMILAVGLFILAFMFGAVASRTGVPEFIKGMSISLCILCCGVALGSLYVAGSGMRAVSKYQEPIQIPQQPIVPMNYAGNDEDERIAHGERHAPFLHAKAVA
jgi:hypothetical protein